MSTRSIPTVAFYEHLVGMTTNFRSEGGAALSHDGEHHRIALVAVPRPPR